MFIEMHAKQLIEYCAKLTNTDPKFQELWTPVLESINAELPHGSGFDSGSEFLPEDSTPNRLVFTTSFHHMDEGGWYDGWTEHQIIVTPMFGGFNIRVTGVNRNKIKEYIGDMFHECLSNYFKTEFSKESRTMDIVTAQYDYTFNGPIVRES